MFRGNVEQLPPLTSVRIELLPKLLENTDMVEVLNNTIVARRELRVI